MYFSPLPFRIWHYEDFDVENENKGKQRVNENKTKDHYLKYLTPLG